MGAPGSDIDDGFALALALADPDVSVDLVTTVGGNTDVDTATRLSLELLERFGRLDVPVVRGSAGPAVRRPWSAAPPTDFAAPRTSGSLPGHAATHLVERVMSEPRRAHHRGHRAADERRPGPGSRT